MAALCVSFFKLFEFAKSYFFAKELSVPFGAFGLMEKWNLCCPSPCCNLKNNMKTWVQRNLWVWEEWKWESESEIGGCYFLKYSWNLDLEVIENKVRWMPGRSWPLILYECAWLVFTCLYCAAVSDEDIGDVGSFRCVWTFNHSHHNHRLESEW